MRGWNNRDVAYLSKKFDLPDAYVMSMLTFLDRLAQGGLVDAKFGASLLCYQYNLDKEKGLKIASYYFKQNARIA